MYPSYYCSQVMTDALLLDHQQMVQREIERNRWALAHPTCGACRTPCGHDGTSLRGMVGPRYGRARPSPDEWSGIYSSPARRSHRSEGTMLGLIDAARGRCAADGPTHVMLRDGRPLVIRRLIPGDRPAVAALFAGLSPESRAHRFHSAAVAITPTTLNLVTAGHALVAERGGRLVALGSYVALPDAMQAELALVVADAEQGRGIGTALGACLARDAQRAGLRQFRAEVLSSNRRMLRLLRRLGCGVTSTRTPGALTVYVELCPEPAASARTA